MANNIIIIGIGSTGLDVLEKAQQYYYDFTKGADPKNIKMMFIETDKNRKASLTPDGQNHIDTCYLDPQNVFSYIDNVKGKGGDKYSQWLPNTSDLKIQGLGANGKSVYGRALLWANINSVAKKIEDMDARGDNSTQVYIVGSLSGGTGSGIFIDLAYLVRRKTSTEKIYGMFLLPNEAHTVKNEYYENAYASLRTLDYYTNGKYECRVPDSSIDDISSNGYRPFREVQCLTTDFSNSNAPMSFSSLIDTAGMNLVLRMLDVDNQHVPFSSVVDRRKTDRNNQSFFSTIGLVAYQYPESLLEEYFANQLAENMLRRWVDTQSFVDSNKSEQNIKRSEARIKTRTRKFVEQTINDVIDSAFKKPSSNADTLYKEIENIAESLHTGNGVNGDKEVYVKNLFSITQGMNLYKELHSHDVELRDELIERIHQYIGEQSLVYQNLNVIDIIVREIAEYLSKSITGGWRKRYKITGEAKDWSKAWDIVYAERFTGRLPYSLELCSYEWYLEALMGTAQLCFFDTLIPVLDNISSAMLTTDNFGAMTSRSGIDLPSFNLINERRERIAEMLRNESDENTSIVERKNNIGGKLGNTDNPQIVYLFNGNNKYTDEIDNARKEYERQALDFGFVTDIDPTGNVWNYLADDTEKIQASLTKRSTAFVISHHLFGHTDIHRCMKNVSKENSDAYDKIHALIEDKTINREPSKDEIRDTLPALLKLSSRPVHLGFMTDSQDTLDAKLITVTAKKREDKENIVQSFSHAYAVGNDEYVQLPSLNNTVILYQEYDNLVGNVKFNPILHMAYQPRVREDIDAAIKNGRFDSKLRLAYIDEKTLLDIDNINIK